MKTRFMVLSAALAVASVLAGCGSDDSPSVSEAKEDFCKAVAEVAQDEAALADLNATSTVGDAQAAVANLQDGVDAAKSPPREEVGQAEADALQSAYDGLQSAVDDVSDSDTLAEAAATVIKAHDTFTAQWDAITSKNCGGAAGLHDRDDRMTPKTIQGGRTDE